MIHYMWIGEKPMPEKYRTRLREATYPFVLHVDCDMRIRKHEKRMGAKFKYAQTTIQRADLCRFLLIFDEGGVYSDLDIIMDYECFSKLTKQHSHFFTVGTRGLEGPENYLFYER